MELPQSKLRKRQRKTMITTSKLVNHEITITMSEAYDWQSSKSQEAEKLKCLH